MAPPRAGRRRGRRGGYGGARSSALVTRPLLPPSRRMSLAYAERVRLVESAALAGANWAFSLNSLYDPNVSGTGSQPVGFDQISAFYGQYRVWRVRVKITFSNLVTSTSFVGAFPTYQAVAPASPSAWFCQPYGKSDRVEPTSGVSTRVIYMDVDLPLILGLTRSQYDNDMDFVGTPSGSPTRAAILIVWMVGSSGTAASVDAQVQLEYQAQFSQPLPLNVS